MYQSINLLLSLPTDIQSEIYKYDNTYRIFGNDDFKKELTDALLNSKVAFNKYLKEITQYVTSLTYDDKFYWNNEYGCIDPNNELQKNKTIIRTYADFFIVLDYKNGALYFFATSHALSMFAHRWLGKEFFRITLFGQPGHHFNITGSN